MGLRKLLGVLVISDGLAGRTSLSGLNFSLIPRISSKGLKLIILGLWGFNHSHNRLIPNLLSISKAHNLWTTRMSP